MELLADRDPEEARQLLDPVLERMMAAVHGYEGTVNQVIGDGIMALFGAPIAHEDHAVRASGNDLHLDYTAVGQTTHLTARMEQLAPPGSIRLTAAILRLAEGCVQLNPLGPVPVKGLMEPMEVFELVGATAVYRELGADYLDRIKADHLKRYFLKRLEQLGVQVTVQNHQHVSPLPM
jgi:class 3 adenylate cyclase